MATAAEVQTVYRAVLRTDLNATTAQAVADAINNGTTSLALYQQTLVQQSASTTQAALVLSSFITGTVGDSAKVDSLTAFAKTQNDYYTNVLKSSNAQLGAYEALGRAYASDATTSAAFATSYGALSSTDFINTVYAEAFGGTAPSAGALANLNGQITYFTNLYTAAGIPAASASLQAKGAVLGQILGYAVTADTNNASTFDTNAAARVNAFVTFAQDPTTTNPYSTPIADVTQGNAIAILADGSVSLDTAANGAVPGNIKATAFGDTVSGTISNATVAVSVNTAAGNDSIGTSAAPVTLTQVAGSTLKIDGSTGADVLYATLGASTTAAVTTIANVEKIYLNAGAASRTVEANGITGATELWSFKTANNLTLNNIASGVTLGVEGGTNKTTTFDLATAGAATLALKDAAGAAVVLTDVNALTVNLVSNSTASIDVAGAKTLAVTGAGNANITNVTLAADWTSINASGATGSVGLGGVDASTVAATVQLSAQNDYLTGINLGQATNLTVTTGAGQDYISVATGGNYSTANTALVITDFAKGSDKLDLKAITPAATGQTITLAGADLASLAASSSLTAALNFVATKTDTLGDNVTFVYGADTYVFVNGGAESVYGAGDTLVKLSGVTNLAVGTDILVG